MNRIIFLLCAIIVLNGCKTAPVKPVVKESPVVVSTETEKGSGELNDIIDKFKQEYKPQAQTLPQHIKKIAVRAFENTTSVFGLEDKLYLKVYDEFIHDTRLSVVDEANADGVIVGQITHYILQPLTYGANSQVNQYKLRVLVDLYFIDKVNNVTLWEEKGLEGVTLFYAATEPGGMTEEQARDIVWELIAGKIYRRVMEGFGSVSGAPENKIPAIK